MVDVTATVIMLVHSNSLIHARSSSEIINALQIDPVVLVNQIVV